MMVAGAELRVDGAALDLTVASGLVEVQVETHLRLPDVASVRIADPGLEHIDRDPLPVGARLEILLSAPDSGAMVRVFSGTVATLEPEFTTAGATLAARAYDASYALCRSRRTRTFQRMSGADIARKLATEAGLRPGTIERSGRPLEFVQQSDETDLTLLWRLAGAVDFELDVEDDALNFRRAGGRPNGTPTAVRWGEELLEFRPRITAAQQVDTVTVRGWDPGAKRALRAVATVGGGDSSPGAGRASVRPTGAVGVGDRPVLDQDEADKLATSVAARLANACVEAEGVCRGNPRLRAGGRIQVDGVGTRFGGDYLPSVVRHVFRGGHGYVTRFSVAGRATAGLLGAGPRPARAPWGQGVVIGLVTQNADPDKLARIRVRYPTLGDDVESAWARITAPGAGTSRGALMIPAVGDEVLVAFEHGDVRRPYVLGSLWNGQGRPGQQLEQTDGSFGLRTDARIEIAAKGSISLDGGNDLRIEVSGKARHKADSVVVEAGSVSIRADGDVAIDAGGTLSLSGKEVAVKATGALKLGGQSVALG